MAREALAVTGTVIGAIVGGPVGAQIGFTIGNMIGGYIDPDIIPGPNLGEAPVQTGRDGVPLPIVWGTCYLHGNIIQQGPISEITRKKRISKSQKVTETTRLRTFAIGFCAGPIEGYSRIWENGKLVYDSRGVSSVVNAADHADYASMITEYYGTEDQLPDPDLEAVTGVGNQLAYRGLALIVWPDYDITDFASAIPQYAVEVNGGADLGVSSKPYPVEAVDGLQSGSSPADSRVLWPPLEGINSAQTPQDGSLASPLKEYVSPPEGIDAAHVPQNGTLTTNLKSYETDAEGIDSAHTPKDGTLRDALVAYVEPPEGILTAHTPKDGSLS